MMAAQPPVLAAEQFVNSNFSAAWSPDGQALAYVSRRGIDGPAALVVRSWKTRESRVVPVELALYADTRFVWFPDGRSVLVASSSPYGLYRVDVASGAVQLVHPPAVAFFDFLRHGRTVLYGMTDPVTKQGGGQIDRFDIDTGRLTTIKRTKVKGLRVTSLAVSPDGKQLAYILENNKMQENSLEVMPASGAESREIFRGPAGGFAQLSGIAWSADQRYLLFVRGVNTQNAVDVSIWRAPVSGGQIANTGITVYNAPDDSVLAFPSVHPDGRHIAFTKRERFTEVRTLQNFLPKAAVR
jgi:Tol biopolymer transport system component